MNIIICGAGRVGFTIAKQLTEQNHSITIIDQSSEDIQKISDSLDVKAIVGKATMPSVLEKAHNDETDMIIAVTKNDEINIRTKKPEFLDWKWIDLEDLTKIAVNFKLKVYQQVKSEIKKILD